METRQQRLVREALAHGSKKPNKDQAPEVSLRDQSLKHTDPDYVPRTLTPHEWEAYYVARGVPEAHRSAPSAQRSSQEGRFSCLRSRLAAWLGSSR